VGATDGVVAQVHEVDAGLLRRLDRWRQSQTRPSAGVRDAEARRRAGMLAHVALVLTLILGIAAVVSLFTSIAFPDPDVSLGFGGTAVIAVTAVAFGFALWLARQPRFELGAWATVITIDGFLCALSALFPDRAVALSPGYAAPVVCATIFLRARGTVIVFVLSAIVGTVVLIVSSAEVVEVSFVAGIMLAVTTLMVVVAILREQDLAQVVRLREMEHADAARLHGELELARRVQMAMMPDELPTIAGLDVAAFTEPAYEASGDFYDVFEVDGPPGQPPSLALVVCDVAGKGVASALVMSATRAALRAAAERSPSPSAVLAKVNDTLAASVPAGLFVTLCYAVYEPGSRLLRCASGGHPHPLHRGFDGRVRELETYGMPLGLVAGSQYAEGSWRLEPGDVVALFTDGLVEALDAERAMYGFDRSREDFGHRAGGSESAAACLDGMLADMRAFVGGEGLHDDVTVVTLAVPVEVDLDAPSAPVAAGARGEPGWTTER
jgi:serine phosphatase RsbU (regulator of sigma subunit)